MLLLQHCVTYLKPVHKDMSVYEQWLGLSSDDWAAQNMQDKADMQHQFMLAAESCIIMGATLKEKGRLQRMWGVCPQWYYDTNPECKGLPIRHTSPFSR